MALQVEKLSISLPPQIAMIVRDESERTMIPVSRLVGSAIVFWHENRDKAAPRRTLRRHSNG